MIAVEDLRRLVNRHGARIGLAAGEPSAARTAGADDREYAKRKKKEDGMKQSQKLLLTWLIEDAGLFHKIRQYITPDDFTEEIYCKAAQILFAQFEEAGAANPAKIVSMFQSEEEQREIAEIFNATIREVRTKEDREKALKETIVRVKENSISHRSRNMDPTDMEGLMKLVEAKRALEALEKLHISTD